MIYLAEINLIVQGQKREIFHTSLRLLSNLSLYLTFLSPSTSPDPTFFSLLVKPSTRLHAFSRHPILSPLSPGTVYPQIPDTLHRLNYLISKNTSLVYLNFTQSQRDTTQSEGTSVEIKQITFHTDSQIIRTQSLICTHNFYLLQGNHIFTSIYIIRLRNGLMPCIS